MIDSDHSSQFRQSLFIKNVPKFFQLVNKLLNKKTFKTVHFDAETYLMFGQNVHTYFYSKTVVMSIQILAQL